MNVDHVTVGPGSSMGGDDPAISDAVRVGDLLFLSGRAAVDPATLQVVGDDFNEQALIVLRDIEAVLTAAGSDWGHVLRIECFLAAAADFAVWNRIWRERFAAPRPARTTVVCEFAVPGILIELQVTAAVAGLEP
jgi:2-iminobutanoate/2-iminopropanoate deaminase